MIHKDIIKAYEESGEKEAEKYDSQLKINLLMDFGWKILIILCDFDKPYGLIAGFAFLGIAVVDIITIKIYNRRITKLKSSYEEKY